MIIKVAIMAALPFVLSLVYSLFKGGFVGRTYLPAGEWNDELFYYKQVECILNGGYPAGFFGFNESQAQVLSFAAWSPVLLLPWIVWGLIFGWTFMSPVYCNIFFLTLAFVVFVLVAKPDLKQTILIAAGSVSFTHFARQMMSAMPEITCFSLVIMFYAFAYSYTKKPTKCALVFMFIFASLLTLMRPYLLLLLVLVIYFCIREYKWKGALISAGVLVVTLGLYWAIKKYFGAEYFADLFFTDWVKAYFDQGLFGGIKYTLSKLHYMGADMIKHMILGLSEGLCSGAIFICYVAMIVITLVQSLVDRIIYKKDPEKAENFKKDMTIELHFGLSLIAMLIALLLMYKLTEGSKHLLTFIVAGIIIFGMRSTKYASKTFIIVAMFVFFFIIKAGDPYDYKPPFENNYITGKITEWTTVMNEEIELNLEEKPSFDNVIIWVFTDEIDGKERVAKWQYLYGTPKGMGISCCTSYYINNNIDDLKSKYIMTPVGGEIAKKISKRGAKLLYEDEDCALYQLR